MDSLSKLISGPIIGVALLGASGLASAVDVTLSGFSSSQPDRFVIPGADLVGSIFDLELLDFSVTNGSISDTLSFTITAAPGEVIREVVLREEGAGTLDGFGLLAAAGEITVAGIAKTAGNFFTLSSGGSSSFEFENSSSSGTLFEFTVADGLTSAFVTISNILTAGAIGPLGGSIEKTLARLTVTTSPIPLPPAAWMLGSALVGLVAVGRRKLGV